MSTCVSILFRAILDRTYLHRIRSAETAVLSAMRDVCQLCHHCSENIIILYLRSAAHSTDWVSCMCMTVSGNLILHILGWFVGSVFTTIAAITSSIPNSICCGQSSILGSAANTIVLIACGHFVFALLGLLWSKIVVPWRMVPSHESLSDTYYVQLADSNDHL